MLSMKNSHNKKEITETRHQKLFNIVILSMMILNFISLLFITQAINDNVNAIRNIDEKIQSISQGNYIQ